LPAGEGLVVLRVVPDSPAHNAGLAEYDILLKANGESLRSVNDLVQTVSESGEKPIQLEWFHESKVKKAEIQPAKRPQHRPIAEPRRPFQLRFYGPAFKVPENLDKEFPNDLKIEIRKEGGQPLHIAVRKGDRTWELNEDELGELPAEVRTFVDQLVGKSFTLGFPRLEEFEKQFDFNVDIPAPKDLKLELKRRIPSATQELEERLEQLNERLDGLYDELRQLRGAKDDTEEDDE
jgi:hypothetical protein